MLRIFCAFVLLVLAPCESRVVSHSAVSKVSAEDADRLALAGIAMQIRANVETFHRTEKAETLDGNRSELRINYSESVFVESDVSLSGVEFRRKKLANGQWETVASFDTEKAAAPFRRTLLQIRGEAAKLQGEMKEFVKRGNFGEAFRILDALEILQGNFQKSLSQMEVFEVPDDSCSFGVDVRLLESALVRAMKNVGMAFAGENTMCDSCDTLGPISVRVENSHRPLQNVSVVAREGKSVLAAEKTDSSGIARFLLDVGKLSPGEHRIDFLVRFPGISLEKVNSGLHINYFSKKRPCGYSLICSEKGEVCARVGKLLSDAGFDSKENAKSLCFRATSQKRDVFDGGSPIFRIDFSLELVGENAKFQKLVKGAGTSESLALENAIEKLRPAEIRRSLFPLCEIR